jgi:hypothetical protein
MSQGNRNKLLHETVHLIMPVASRLNDVGVSLRFINYTKDGEFDRISTTENIEKTLEMVAPRGATPIGTVLRKKIVDPILEKARAGKLVTPVLVVIITDGEVTKKQKLLRQYLRFPADTQCSHPANPRTL